MRKAAIQRFRKKTLKAIDYIMDTDLEVLSKKHSKGLFNFIILICTISISYSLTGISTSLKEINKGVLTIHTSESNK